MYGKKKGKGGKKKKMRGIRLSSGKFCSV